MKNPHLIETQIIVPPITGLRIQDGVEHANWIANGNAQENAICIAKSNGNIPRIELNFNLQGIPLLLTTQSYMVLKLKPKFADAVTGFIRAGALPTSFDICTEAWPKLNSNVLVEAQATFSNYGMDNPHPFFNNYIRHLQLQPPVYENSKHVYNDSIVETLAIRRGEAVAQNNIVQVFNTPNNTVNLSNVISPRPDASPYNVTWSLTSLGGDRDGFRAVWNPTEFEIRVPLEEILPVFQVPVIPLAQTNTSSIQLRVVLNSPRHMFFMSRALRPRGADLVRLGGAEGNVPPWLNGFEGMGEDIHIRAAPLANEAQLRWINITNRLIGADVYIANAVSATNIIEIAQPNTFAFDFDVDCYLNLKVLTDPMLNPLVEAYIRPFLTPMNEFRGVFQDSFYFSKVMTVGSAPNKFEFRPSQLFYNATQLGLFFQTSLEYLDTKLPPEAEVPGRIGDLSPLFVARNAACLNVHGQYYLPPDAYIQNFQILLGSSCVPLFDHPLDRVGMEQATEDCMKKYGPENMVGKIVQTKQRLSQGSAFFLFDLTHTNGSGYFIDADNMITVRGEIFRKIPELNYGNAQGQVPADQRTLNTSSVVQVTLVVFYKNTFTVVLPLDGAVLVQQT